MRLRVCAEGGKGRCAGGGCRPALAKKGRLSVREATPSSEGFCPKRCTYRYNQPGMIPIFKCPRRPERSDVTFKNGGFCTRRPFRSDVSGIRQIIADSLKGFATGVKEGGDRPTVREQIFQAEVSARKVLQEVAIISKFVVLNDNNLTL